MRFPNPSFLCTTCFCTFLVSRGLLRRYHLAGQGGAQAASSWAFCLQGHRVVLSVGVVGSPPRHPQNLATRLASVETSSGAYLASLTKAKLYSCTYLSPCLRARNSLRLLSIRPLGI